MKPLSQSTVSIHDRAFNYGDGCFTTMLVCDNTILLLAQHIRRLQSDSRRLHINNIDFEQLQHDLIACARSLSEGYHVIKVFLSRGIGGRGYQPSADAQAQAHISVFDYHQHACRDSGIRLGIAQMYLSEQALLAGIKHANRLEQVLAKIELSERNDSVQDLLLCDRKRQIIEASSANVFCLIDQVWYTPKLDSCGVSGVMRNFILRAFDGQYAIEEAVLPASMLETTQAMFLCNALTPVLAVREIVSQTTRALDVTIVHQLRSEIETRLKS